MFEMPDADIEALLRKISEYGPYQKVEYRDLSLLTIRRIAEMEQGLRSGESKHARLFRHAARPKPVGFLKELEEESAAAIAWRDDEVAKGYTPLHSFEYASWPDEERVVFAYRERLCRDAF